MERTSIGRGSKSRGNKVADVFISRGYTEEVSMSCDMCGKKAHVGKVHTCYNSVYLCSGCLNYLQKLPMYSQKCIERFMIGNVV